MRLYKFVLSTILISTTLHGVSQSQSDITAAYNHYYITKQYDSSRYFFKILVDQNPYNYDYRVKLALANFYTDHYDLAIQSFKKAMDIGPWTDIYAYYIAASYAYMDSLDLAGSWLEKSVFEYNWPDYLRLERSKYFTPLKEHPSYKKVFGHDQISEDRNEAWRNDLHFVYDKMKLLHFNLYRVNSAEVWDHSFNKIYSAIPELSDREVVIELMKFAALAEEGHTKILPPENGDNAFHSLPLELYWFNDGLFIISATDAYVELIGSQITQIGSKKVEELYDLSYPYRGHDNKMHHKKISPRYLRMAEALKDMGANDNLESVELGCRKNNKNKKTIIQFNTLEELDSKNWKGLEVKETDLPFYRDRDLDFWHSHIKELDAFYVTIKYILNNDETNFKNYIDSAFSDFDKGGAKKLIIDLRNAGGGNSSYNKYLISEIIRRPSIDSDESLFVLIGRETYSAAMNLASDLEYWTDATFIGEPTGSSPNFIGESNALKLPNSQLYLIISNRYHQGGANNSLDNRPWIAPDILAEFSSEDYFKKKDPALEVISDNYQ
ncbi:MAG: hypothetical protein RLN88_13210 [Ekhidna sp.]|uniref:hypothetical protein n=1 Tax=Ekhidna sp. TaxID=2608089 RepID=UPI0032EB6C28